MTVHLRDLLDQQGLCGDDHDRAIFQTFGVLSNPFPGASQTTGHPRLPGEADKKIARYLQEFQRDDHPSQAIIILGTQGAGKTNLLNWYQEELQDFYRDNEGYYIIRYYPDPEQSFDPILHKIFEDLYENRLFQKLAEKLATLGDGKERQNSIEVARHSELRSLLKSLAQPLSADDLPIEGKAALALEWLIGMRVLNRHKDALGVRLRLDTLEAKTRVLHDLVAVASHLNALRGIFLLLDELEKLDHSLSKLPVTRFLLAVRALIDALPDHLFMMLAMTPAAMYRYFSLLPALQGRLQTRIELLPLENFEQAKKLYDFYLDDARQQARSDNKSKKYLEPGKREILTLSELNALYEQLSRTSGQQAARGVTQRAFLDKLHHKTEEKFSDVSD